MNRLILLVSLVVILALGGTACVKTNTSSVAPPEIPRSAPNPALAAHPSLAHIRAVMADPAKPHFTIVALGDSNTELNWTSRGHLNWVGLLSAGLFESGYPGRYTVINSGFSGDSATKALDRLDRDVLAYNPDLVIITFGGNDERLNTAEQTEVSMRELIRRVRAAGQSSILVRTPVPFFDDKGGFEEHANLALHVDAIRRAARAEDVALLDVYALWTAPDQPLPPSTYRYDRLHPNEYGHRRMYGEIAPLLGLHETLRWEK